MLEWVVEWRRRLLEIRRLRDRMVRVMGGLIMWILKVFRMMVVGFVVENKIKS